KTHGDPNWDQYPSYLSYAVPRILDFLDNQETTISFFIVAQDAAFESNREVLGEIAHRGHEIGNHTFHHDPWLHLYSEEEIDHEITRAEEFIELATGVKPRGFRGPGFSFSENVLKVLTRKNYLYDASTFPNILNPLARAYFLATSNLSKEERKQRAGLFGSWKDGFRPNKPYHWQFNEQQLLEIPVTTMPLFKVPIHTSYILYLATYSVPLAMAYFRFVLMMCRISRTSPSILLHPLDFIGKDDTTALSFFPAMNVESQKKLMVMGRVFEMLKKEYHLVDMQTHAGVVLEEGKTKVNTNPGKIAFWRGAAL
ncbi:MAG: polysaccharide deacetylase family protein, partial [Bacteroidetes bacterium]|nr:polysaccharide deacetylase family protein [Bacteroidota bacterium]